MIHIETEWKAFFQSQRLLLVTSVRNEVLEWFESMEFFFVHQPNSQKIRMRGRQNGAVIVIEFIDQLGEFSIAIEENNQYVLYRRALIPSIEYRDTHITGEEAKALYNFFDQLYFLMEETLKQ